MASYYSPFECRKQIMSDDSDVLKDIVFLVGENEERVPAFKQILALSNPVFKAMLYGEFKHENEIKIPEFEAEDFRQFLNYMYFQEIDLKRSNPLNIYEIAHKYMVQSLCDLCSYTVLSYNNIFTAFEWNRVYQIESLSEGIKDFVLKNTAGCLKMNPGYKGLGKESVSELLKWEELKCSEILLYDHLLLWAEQQLKRKKKRNNENNKKLVMGDLLSLIRLKIDEDDLSYEPSIETRYKLDTAGLHFYIVKDKSKAFDYEAEIDKKVVCFGFKTLITNLSSIDNTGTACFCEDFKFMYSKTRNGKYKEGEKFQVMVKDSVAVKDFHFKLPLVFEGSKVFIKFRFKKIRDRIMSYSGRNSKSINGFNGSASINNSNSTRSNSTNSKLLILLTEPFVPELHSIFQE